MIENILDAIGLHRSTGIVFGDYETFLEVSLTSNLIFFAFQGPVDKFVRWQAELTTWFVKAACGFATRKSRRPEELDHRVERSNIRLERVAKIIIFICRLCLPVVAITTLWLLAAYDSDEDIDKHEYWLVLSMAVPIVLGIAALYVAYFLVALWHSFVAAVLTVYFRGETNLTANAPNVVSGFEEAAKLAKEASDSEGKSEPHERS